MNSNNIFSYKIILAILFLNFLSILTIVVLLWTLKANDTEPGCKTLCTPCSTGVLALASLCCGCIVKQFRKHIHKTVKEKTDSFLASDGLERHIVSPENRQRMTYEPWEVNPSSLLHGVRNQEKCNGKSQFETVRNWHHLSHIGYLRNGMELINGRLFIPTSGIYNIYIYMHLEETCDQPKLKDMEQKVFRYNILEREEKELFSHVRPYTESLSKGHKMYGNYMNSDVRLEAGDFVYIKVSNISELRLDDRNYFGTYKL